MSQLGLDTADVRPKRLRRARLLNEADRICRGEATGEPDEPAMLQLRGLLALEHYQPDFGIACLRRAVALQPAIETYATILEEVLRAGRRVAPPPSPYDIDTCRLIAAVLHAQGTGYEASSAWCRLGEALDSQGRRREAADAYQKAVSRSPRHLKAWVGLGWCHIFFYEMTAAIGCFEAALQLHPGDKAAHFGLQWACGLAENYERAWQEVAWFELHVPKERRTFEQPLWDGCRLDGRTLLLWADAGLGDVVQRMRYIPLVAARGARVLVECDRKILSLIATIPGVAEAVLRDTPLPPFDSHAPLSLLPGIFRANARSLPGPIPYATPAPALVNEWRTRLAPSDETLVGLSWACRSLGAFKSIPLNAYAPLARLPDVRFVSLQLGPQAAELLEPPCGLRVEQVLDESCTVADTAALVSSLDLVISVETMIPHLAGAMGKPVWMLTAYGADWRWLHGTDLSPWYPTMQLFRQREPGEWTDVVERVTNALENVKGAHTR